MAIKSNITQFTPSRETMKTEITVLSHGYYTAGKWQDGKVTVYPWDSYVDDLLLRKVKGGNKSDLALYDIIPRVCALNGVPLDSILVGDARTILLVSRAARKSCKITIPIPGKKDDGGITISIPDQLERIAEKTENYIGYDTVTLPVSKDVVAIRPLTVGDERLISQRSDDQRLSLPDRIMGVLVAIVSVGDGKPDTQEELQAYWDALTPTDQQYLYDQQDLLYPHLSSVVTLTDTDTHTEHKISLDLDSEFFR
jgi:hypothetical protein